MDHLTDQWSQNSVFIAAFDEKDRARRRLKRQLGAAAMDALCLWDENAAVAMYFDVAGLPLVMSFASTTAKNSDNELKQINILSPKWNQQFILIQPVSISGTCQRANLGKIFLLTACAMLPLVAGEF